jgi:hypothetical protein
MEEIPASEGRPDQVRAVMERLRAVPALVRDRHLTVIASNPLAKALSPSFEEGVNLARFTFIDAAVESGEPCWVEATHAVAAMLRESLDAHDEDAPFRGLVGELSAKSARFSEAWADDSQSEHAGTATFVHDVLGAMTLGYREHWLDDSRDAAVIVWRGETDEAAERLSRLSELVRG